MTTGVAKGPAASGEERLLILRARAGDPEAFAALVAARRSRLLALLAATVGDWDEAEDALQDALWRAFTALRGLREASGFDAWLRTLVLNVARDRVRAQVARLRREGRPGGDGADLERLLECTTDAAGRSGAAGGVGAALVEREACADLLAAIATLPPVSRSAGRLAWVAGVPQRQVGELLGLSAEGVRAALHRGRRRMGAMFYAKGDWRRDVEAVPAGTVRVAGYGDVGAILARAAAGTAPPPATAVDLHAEADMSLRLFWAQAPGRRAAPPPPAEALPLEGLCEAAGFDLEPFGRRLARFSVGGRLYALPHHDTPHLFLYNADLLARAGLHPPRPDWTWEEFFGYCGRCAAAGWHPINAWCPNGWDVALVAEQLGATRERLQPVREAVAFVRDWRARDWAAPEPLPDGWGFGQFLAGGCVFFIMQYGHGAAMFRDPRFRPFRWGVAPMPRFRRSDAPVRYWFHFALQIRGTAADPTAACAVAQAIFRHGPVPELDSLPAYRTPEVMRAWLAQPWPLGKECLLDLDAATDPLYEPAHFVALPDAGEALDGMVEGRITAEEGLRRLQAGVDRYRAGERPVYED